MPDIQRWSQWFRVEVCVVFAIGFSMEGKACCAVVSTVSCGWRLEMWCLGAWIIRRFSSSLELGDLRWRYSMVGGRWRADSSFSSVFCLCFFKVPGRAYVLEGGLRDESQIFSGRSMMIGQSEDDGVLLIMSGLVAMA